MTVETVNALAAGAVISSANREMFSTLAARAEQYYQSAEKLLPLIDADSRAALWVLVAIYHRLLHRIAAARGDVFSRRISVPAGEKLWILARGGTMSFANRIRG
jgi:phytoene synthase